MGTFITKWHFEDVATLGYVLKNIFQLSGFLLGMEEVTPNKLQKMLKSIYFQRYITGKGQINFIFVFFFWSNNFIFVYRYAIMQSNIFFINWIAPTQFLWIDCHQSSLSPSAESRLHGPQSYQRYGLVKSLSSLFLSFLDCWL